ncbi:hypothetical protein HYX08_06980 [Candidatus Woesearchaeota archaeon]|nr:hypothetical protein [Candidatus Woesearchaeota archaeon]
MAKFNFYLGAAASAWLLAIMVITAELIAPFKNLLKALFTHHWIGKAVIVTTAFLVFGLLLRGKEQIGNFPDGKISWYSMLGSLIAIFLFFAAEFLM